MKKLNQDGFSFVELLVVVVIVGLIGAVGWLVYERQKSNNSNNTSNSEQVSTQENEQVVMEDNAQNVETQSIEDGTENAGYFEIKTLGVKFKTNEKLTGLYYTVGNEGRTVYFSLNELKNTECAADKTAQVALTRYSEEDFQEDPQAAANKSSAKKIGNYYYFDIGGQASCSEDSSIQAKASTLKAEISRLLPTALVKL